MALRDLERIRDFIARDNPKAAVSFCHKLLDRAEALREFPERGGYLKERPGARFSVVGSYLIVYRLDQAAETVQSSVSGMARESGADCSVSAFRQKTAWTAGLLRGSFSEWSDWGERHRPSPQGERMGDARINGATWVSDIDGAPRG